jgi:predicted ATP-dependent serine protease
MTTETKSNPLAQALETAILYANDLDVKSTKIKEVRTNTQYKRIVENETKAQAMDKIDLFNRSPDYYEKLAEDNSEYLDSAKESPEFLTEDFNDVVPFFPKNLIIIGAKSGEGKSTIASNIALGTISQNKHCLMITNEEVDTDVFNRITCLIKKWKYTNHKEFTAEQKAAFNANYKFLGNRLSVINDMSNGTGGATTTLQGLRSILDKVVASEIKPGCIIIDYFQNICEDIETAGEGEYFVLKRVASLLDKYRKYVGCPIVVMVQLKAQADEASDFKFRIEHCKEIYTKATCALEVKADRENHRTIFTPHKGRFNEHLGKDIPVGFDKGRYVKYDQAFKLKAIAEMDNKKNQDLRANVFNANKQYEKATT